MHPWLVPSYIQENKEHKHINIRLVYLKMFQYLQLYIFQFLFLFSCIASNILLWDIYCSNIHTPLSQQVRIFFLNRLIYYFMCYL